MHTLEATTVVTIYSHEIINHGYYHYVDIMTQQTFDDLINLIGQEIQFSYVTQSSQRRFSGYLQRVEEGKFWHNCRCYKLQLISSLNTLDYEIDYRSFNNSTLKTIIDNIFSTHELAKPHYQTSHENSKINYCVQYQEKTADFIRRLLADHQLIIIYKDNLPIITDQSTLKSQPIKQLHISNLKQNNYHAWNKTTNSCYSNYPDLHLGDLINDHNIVTEIRHYIDNTQHYYYQYLKFSPTITSKKIAASKTNGIQPATLTQNNIIHADWDRSHQHKRDVKSHLPGETRSLLNFCSDKKCHTVISYIKQQPTQPIIKGYLYNKHTHAAFTYTHARPHYGLAATDNTSIRFDAQSPFNCSFETAHNLTLDAANNISLKTTDHFKINTQSSLKISSDQIIIKSNSKIELTVGKSSITLLPNKIKLLATRIKFYT